MVTGLVETESYRTPRCPPCVRFPIIRQDGISSTATLLFLEGNRRTPVVATHSNNSEPHVEQDLIE